MPECTLHPDAHATGELIVYDKQIDDKLTLPICEDCIDAYDRVRDRYTVQTIQ